MEVSGTSYCISFIRRVAYIMSRYCRSLIRGLGAGGCSNTVCIVKDQSSEPFEC